MKFNNLSMIFGILFAIGLGVVAYLNLFVSLILAFGGNDWFGYMLIIFAVLAVVTLISSFFARKKIMVLLVADVVSLAIVLFEIVYLFIAGIMADAFVILLVVAIVFVLGALSVMFGILAKKKSKAQNKISLETNE